MNRLFDLSTVPVSGTHLIEASAGTGKTYSIAGLYLRLVVEEGFRVPQILVVTYTEAATEELKTRIRERLNDMKRYFEADSAPGDDDLARSLLSRYPAGPGRKEALLRLRLAVLSMDEASIFTIHGFCKRVLRENAFECGAAFSTDVEPDSSALILEAAEDWYRRTFYNALPDEVRFAQKLKLTPDALGLLYSAATRPGIKVLPESCERRPVREVLGECRAHYKSLQDFFTEHGEAFSAQYALLEKANGEMRLGLMKEYLRSGNHLAFSLIAGDASQAPFKQFTREKIGRHLAALPHGETFVGLFEACYHMSRTLVTAYRFEFLEFMDRTLQERKAEQDIRHFDDLLRDVDASVRAAAGQLLSVVRQEYRAALIDEFQDTNPLQWNIFKTIFNDGHHTLFLIGDPKQSIFAFSGADVQTYHRAGRAMASHWTLAQNHRSTEKVVNAVNALFSRPDHADPFYSTPGSAIAFTPSGTAPKNSTANQPEAYRSLRPFTICFLKNSAEDAKPILADEAREKIALWIADEIRRLLKPPSKINPHDFGILVRANYEAQSMQRTLSRFGITAVLERSGLLFQSRDARQMFTFLSALSAPGKKRLLLAAASLDWFGYTANELASESGLEIFEEEMAERRSQFRKEGFYRMFRELLKKHHSLQGLLRYWDGERRVTNLLHLAEVLQLAIVQNSLSMDGIASWTGMMITTSVDAKSEEHEIRLEKDELASRIVTVHKAKGLQYPIVFAPYMWSTKDVKGDYVTYHEKETEILNLDPAALALATEQKEDESLSEELRLLYVALTRSQQAGYLFWGHIKDSEESAPAYLLYGKTGEELPAKEAYAAVIASLESMTQQEKVLALPRAEEISAEEKSNADFSGRIPEQAAPPVAVASPPLSPRDYSGSVPDCHYRITSYTQLVRTPHSEAYERDDEDHRDSAGGLTAAPVANRAIFDFPAGAAEGTFFHAILENMDFAVPDKAALEALAHKELKTLVNGRKEEGARWNLTAVVTTLTDLMRAALTGNDSNAFSLSQVSKEQRLSEWEFNMVLGPGGFARLKDLFAVSNHFYAEAIKTLSETEVHGFLNGFVDLIFEHNGRWYIVDWKSNRLGTEKADYAQDALKQEMIASHYVLQYHIYTAALHLFLTHRLEGYDYKKHFGGIYYAFLRGVHPEWGPMSGIFFDRPDAGFVRGMADALTAGQS